MTDMQTDPTNVAGALNATDPKSADAHLSDEGRAMLTFLGGIGVIFGFGGIVNANFLLGGVALFLSLTVFVYAAREEITKGKVIVAVIILALAGVASWGKIKHSLDYQAMQKVLPQLKQESFLVHSSLAPSG